MGLARFFPVCLAAVSLSMSLAVPASSRAASDGPQIALAGGSALDAWASGQHWRLYGMGTEESRAAIPEREFSEEMAKGARRPRGDAVILDIRQTGALAIVAVKVTLELVGYKQPYAPGSPTKPRSAEETVQIMLMHQDGEWRINLHQFIGLSQY